MKRRQRLTNIGVGVLVGVSFTLTMTGRISYGAHWFVLSMVYLLGFVRLAIVNNQLFRDLDEASRQLTNLSTLTQCTNLEVRIQCIRCGTHAVVERGPATALARLEGVTLPAGWTAAEGDDDFARPFCPACAS